MRTFLLLFLFILSSQIHAQSLKPVAEKVYRQKAAVGAFQQAGLFDDDLSSTAGRSDLDASVSAGVLAHLDPTAIQTLREENRAQVALQIPVPGGKPLELELVRAEIFSPEFKVFDSKDRKNPVQVDLGLHYWGIVKDRPNTTASISIFADEVMGIISTGTDKYIVGALNQDPFKTHIIYRERDLKIANPSFCAADELAEVTDGEEPAVSDRAADNCVRMYVEADYTIFQNKGTVAAATSYVTGFFSQVSQLYTNESVNVVLHELIVWSTADPYTGPTSSDYLNQFRTTLNGVYNGDLAHLVGFTGGGGIAYVDVLCNKPYGVGYSGVNTTYSNVPTYSWTVEVVTHEIGHNLGSKHTHACAWNGNNTAIDGCGPAAGYSEGCSGPLPTSGTIMSYCHLVSGVGIDFNNGFGPQPGDRIRSEVYNAPCLAPCGGGGGGCTYSVVNTQNFETSWGIWTDGGTDCARINNAANATSGTYSIQLRDDTGTSVMSTTNQNYAAYNEIKVDFNFKTISFDNVNEDFWLQISTNGGTTYTTVQEWDFSEEFTNGVFVAASATIPGPFTSTTRVRLRCHASADDDQVHFDDVVISGCTPNFAPGEPSDDRLEQKDGAQIESMLLSPNPATDRLTVQYQLSAESPVQLMVTDLNGKIVYRQRFQSLAGEQSIQLDLKGLSAGIYALNIVAEGNALSRKLVVTK